MDQLEVRVHEEINSYKEKFYGLTLRQWIAVIITVVFDVPFYIFARQFIADDFLQILVILISVPTLGMGFITIQQLPLEKFIKYFFRNYLDFYQPILYKSDKDVEDEKKYYDSLTFFQKMKYDKMKKKELQQMLEKRKVSEQESENNTENTSYIEDDTNKTETTGTITEENKLSRKEIRQIKKQEKINQKSLKKQKKTEKKEAKRISKEERILQKIKAKEEKKARKSSKNRKHQAEVDYSESIEPVTEQNSSIDNAFSPSEAEISQNHSSDSIHQQSTDSTDISEQRNQTSENAVIDESEEKDTDKETKIFNEHTYSHTDDKTNKIFTDSETDKIDDDSNVSGTQMEYGTEQDTSDTVTETHDDVTENDEQSSKPETVKDTSEDNGLTDVSNIDFSKLSDEQLGAMMRAFLNRGGK